MKKKLAKLTIAEEKAWEHAIRYHIVDGKQGQDEAGRRAWRDICKEFPRLRKYEGAAMKNKIKKVSKPIITTNPHGAHELRLVDKYEDARHPDGCKGNNIYELVEPDGSSKKQPVIGFTGEELTSLAWQWLNHAGELHHVKSLAILAATADKQTIAGRRGVAARATLVQGLLENRGAK